MKTKPNWIIEGLIAGIIFIAISIVSELMEDPISFEGMWRKIIIFLVAGLGYGLSMKYYRRKKN